jgi:hypothetical protein
MGLAVCVGLGSFAPYIRTVHFSAANCLRLGRSATFLHPAVPERLKLVPDRRVKRRRLEPR